MKKFNMYVASLITLVAVGAHGAAGRDNVVNSYGCAGTGNCNFIFNAVGDRKSIDVNVSAIRLGLISGKKTMRVNMPSLNGQKLFTLAISQPYSNSMVDKSIVGKSMELLFVSSLADDEAKKLVPSAVSMVKLYRRLSGETLWTEFSSTVSSVMPSQVNTQVTIEPNGNATYVIDEQGNTETGYLGKAIIG